MALLVQMATASTQALGPLVKQAGGAGKDGFLDKALEAIPEQASKVALQVQAPPLATGDWTHTQRMTTAVRRRVRGRRAAHCLQRSCVCAVACVGVPGWTGGRAVLESHCRLRMALHTNVAHPGHGQRRNEQFPAKSTVAPMCVVSPVFAPCFPSSGTIGAPPRGESAGSGCRRVNHYHLESADKNG